MLTGENGILTQAQKAKTETEKTQKEEENILTTYKDFLKNSTNDTAIVGKIVTGENKQYSKNGTAIIPVGFAIVPGLDNIEQGLVISDKENDINDEGNQFVWIPVESEEQYVRNIYTGEEISKTTYTDTSYLPNGIQPLLDDSTSNENAEKDAVLQFGGFYISRYEAGREEDMLVSKKGATIWNMISQTNCKTTAKTFIDNQYVKSALCSGIQWDKTMDFIDGKLDGSGNNTFDVTTYNANRHTGEGVLAGQNEADKVCNIYDLEGNYLEYTAEKNYYNDLSVHRGGIYNDTQPASHRGTFSGTALLAISFRIVLYVM